jgi:5,10-methylenetetrahydromethanopterin reductase
VRVGLGIMPAVFRNASATGMEVSALARLFPGRFAAGIGHGLQSWMSQIGERVASPMTVLEEVTAVVRKMIRGGSINFDGTHVKVDNIELVYPAIDVPPVLLGVTGPKSVELSGRIADGTILSEWVGPAYVRNARELINRGRAAAGAENATLSSGFEPATIPAEHELVVFVNTMLSSEHVDARMVMRQSIAPKILDGSLARAFSLMGVTKEVDRLASLGLPSNELENLIPDAWIDELAAAGTPEQIQTMFRALIDAGADTIVMIPFVGKHDPELARYSALVDALRT